MFKPYEFKKTEFKFELFIHKQRELEELKKTKGDAIYTQIHTLYKKNNHTEILNQLAKLHKARNDLSAYFSVLKYAVKANEIEFLFFLLQDEITWPIYLFFREKPPIVYYPHSNLSEIRYYELLGSQFSFILDELDGDKFKSRLFLELYLLGCKYNRLDVIKLMIEFYHVSPESSAYHNAQSGPVLKKNPGIDLLVRNSHHEILKYILQVLKRPLHIMFYSTMELQKWIYTCSRKLQAISLCSDDIDFYSEDIILDKNHIYLVINNNLLQYYYLSSNLNSLREGIIKEEQLQISITPETTLEELKTCYLSIIDIVNNQSYMEFEIFQDNDPIPFYSPPPQIWAENNRVVLECLLTCKNFLNSIIDLPNGPQRVFQFLENSLARNLDTVVNLILIHPDVSIDNKILYDLLGNPDYSSDCKKSIAKKLSSQNTHGFGLFYNNLISTMIFPKDIIPAISDYYFQL